MGFFYIIHVIVCILLICVVLFQDGKTGGLVSVADAGNNVFGARGASSFLTKLTSTVAVIFMFSSIFLAFQSSPSNKSIASDHVPTQQVPGDPTASPGQDPVTMPGDLSDGRPLSEAVEGIDIITDPNEVPPEFRKNQNQQPAAAEGDQSPAKEGGDEKAADGEGQDEE